MRGGFRGKPPVFYTAPAIAGFKGRLPFVLKSHANFHLRTF